MVPAGSDHSPLSLRRWKSTRPWSSCTTAATAGTKSRSWPTLLRRPRKKSEMGMRLALRPGELALGIEGGDEIAEFEEVREVMHIFAQQRNQPQRFLTD